MERVREKIYLKDSNIIPAKQGGLTRRNFTKKALKMGFLSSLALMHAPHTALAWLDGGFYGRDDLDHALRVLVKTYGNTEPYPHKFNDALVKVHLRNLDFAVRKKLEQENAEHYVYVLGPVIERHIKKAIPKLGKDVFLWGIFERTSCSYQLYEHIDIEKNRRSFPCPYKGILEQIQKGLGTYVISWNDVCQKWCSLVWHGFAKKAGGLSIKIEPGETCRVSVV